LAFSSSLLFSDNAKFEEHLQSRSQDISSAISHLFASPQSPSPEVADLQTRLSALLAAEKSHIVELEKSRVEKEQLEERLENASRRYMVAEKKLERAKSAAVAKLERQAIFGGRNDTGSGLGEGTANANKENVGGVNGVADGSDGAADAESSRREAVAVAEKQKEQIEKLESENEKLTAQLTALNIKLTRLSDDDYSRTDLFKHLKSQHEDVIKRINNLEATNVQLREEAEKLQAERTAFRVQLENESQTAVAEKELQLARAESDLARIRTGRDELLADLSIRKASQDQDRAASEHIKELAAARDDRIKALESETERLRIQLHPDEYDEYAGEPEQDLDQLGADELRTKYQGLKQQYSMLNNELPSMGAAWKKASALASQKVTEFTTLEEKVVRLGAEKSKADQKYFAAMKAKEARDQEVRTLRAQNSKSSDIVSQLKDAESSTRALLVNLEKQLVEAKDTLNSLTTQNRTAQQQITEDNIIAESFKMQVGELKKALTAKDASLSTSTSAYRKAEVELEALKVRLEETKKSLESWKSKGLGNQTGEYEMLRVSL